MMVANRNSEGVVDPKLLEKPTSRALKRALLVALRCVDPDASKRPKMGHIIHMLEVDDFPYRDVMLPSICNMLIFSPIQIMILLLSLICLHSTYLTVQSHSNSVHGFCSLKLKLYLAFLSCNCS